jgi:hypothetical protein
MTATQILIPARHKYEIPEWLDRAGPNVLPPGPKQLYKYLLVFGRTGCWQYNCRLAHKFNAEIRTIRRWIAWLKAHNLIRVTQPYNRRRRLYAVLRDSSVDFLAGQCLTDATNAVKTLFRTDAEIRRRKERTLAQLGIDPGLPILPFPGMPTPPHGG